MNQPFPPVGINAPLPGGPALPLKKDVLLVSADEPRGELRTQVMKNLGINVDFASDVAAARRAWRPDLYKLVLLDFPHGYDGAAEFRQEMKIKAPRQRIAFLVGRPFYLSQSPSENGGRSRGEKGSVSAAVPGADPAATTAAGIPNSLPRNAQGPLSVAASRISVIRSVAAKRKKALSAPFGDQQAYEEAARKLGGELPS